MAAHLAPRRYLGIGKEDSFAQIGANRRQAMEEGKLGAKWTSKLHDMDTFFAATTDASTCAEDEIPYGLPF